MSTETPLTYQEQIEGLVVLCYDILVEHKALKRPALFLQKLEITTPNTKRSYGGVWYCKRTSQPWPFVRISTYYSTVQGVFWEYRSHRDDPEIGSFNSPRSIHHMAAVVAHELAHAADFWNGDVSKSGPHGANWKRLYRLLRRELNLTLSNPALSAPEFPVRPVRKAAKPKGNALPAAMTKYLTF